MLNSALSEGSFRMDDLRKDTKSLTDEQQALQRDIDSYPPPTPSSAARANSAWSLVGTRPS